MLADPRIFSPLPPPSHVLLPSPGPPHTPSPVSLPPTQGRLPSPGSAPLTWDLQKEQSYGKPRPPVPRGHVYSTDVTPLQSQAPEGGNFKPPHRGSGLHGPLLLSEASLLPRLTICVWSHDLLCLVSRSSSTVTQAGRGAGSWEEKQPGPRQSPRPGDPDPLNPNVRTAPGPRLHSDCCPFHSPQLLLSLSTLIPQSVATLEHFLL